MLRKLAYYPRLLVKRFKDNTEGAAALEFALLLPILLFLYLAVIEICMAFMVKRRVSHATSQIADIIAQGDNVNKSLLNGYYDVGNMILLPFPSAPLQVRVSSVGKNAQGTVVYHWSHARGMTPYTKGSAVTPTSSIPDGLLNNNTDTYILAESVYGYDSPYDITVPGFSDLLSGITTFRRQFYLRPREIAAVNCTDC